MEEPDEMKIFESSEDTLQEIHSELIKINTSLKTIADFFEKWVTFDGGKPEMYVNADVATHEG